MSPPVVVDTSVLIDHLRGDQRAISLVTLTFDEGRRLIASVMTKVEIMAGTRRKEQQATHALLGLIDWIPVTEEVADIAGGFARDYAASHSGVDPVDYVIAATAAEAGGDLWTLNLRHFPMFPDLAVPY